MDTDTRLRAPERPAAARRRGFGLLIVTAAAAALAAGAAAATTGTVAITAPSPCTAGACTTTVVVDAVGSGGIAVEVDWDHDGPAATGFVADQTFRCGVPDGPTLPYATSGGDACRAQSPVYRTAGSRRVAVRTTPGGGGPPTYKALAFRVTAPASEAGRAKPPKASTGGSAAAALCGAPRAGINCGPGNGRTTAGGGTKVSHKGWPAITGILWQVVMSRGRHQKVGGPANDELLGHHGNEILRGGGGRDVIWGDWDPVGNRTGQVDRLYGDAGNDWLYSSHGSNTISGGPGKDYIWAYYGHGTIDCGPGFDTLRIRIGAPYRYRRCERIKNFCSFGSKPGNAGGCYKPGERPKRRGTR